MKTRFLALPALASLLLAISSAKADDTDQTMFWISAKDSMAGDVGSGDKGTAKAGLNNSEKRHPNPDKSNQWVGWDGSDEITFPSGKEFRLFLKNGDVDTSGEFTLIDENKATLLDVLVKPTSGADTWLSSRHYSLAGQIKSMSGTISCDHQDKSNVEFNGPICLNIATKYDNTGPAVQEWTIRASWGGSVKPTQGRDTAVHVNPSR